MTNRTSYQNWKEFFNKKFEESGRYSVVQENLNEKLLSETYIPLDPKNKTEIKIGYLDDTLIYWKFENPKTSGFNKQQDIEYFYRYDFTEGKSYGEPGLKFIDTNINEIQKQLDNGLRGKEIQYFKNEKLVKSEIYLNFHGKETYPNTIYFEKRNFWKRLKGIFFKEDNSEFQIIEIHLNEIFDGLRNGY